MEIGMRRCVIQLTILSNFFEIIIKIAREIEMS